ncbi:hypothetical protein WMY93_017803 [Mugilogobius chulae]|uniref:Uncharacterized protein n=1 Tax=Mugilogobius chulae TaxID=88201 RepID=A0AAW0NWE5_9GOBI
MPQVDTDTARSKEREAPPSKPGDLWSSSPVLCEGQAGLDHAQIRAAVGTGDVSTGSRKM